MARFVVVGVIAPPTGNAFRLDVYRDILLVTNTGVLATQGGGYFSALLLAESSQTVQNDGSILGYHGIAALGNDSWITIGATGSVMGEYAAIFLVGSSNRVINFGQILSSDTGILAADSVWIENFGRIVGAYAVLSGAGADYLRNAGQIVGNVVLGDGNDSFDGSGGQVQGNIYLGGGNDTGIGGSLADIFDDGDGQDEVFGGAGNDTIWVSNDQDADTFDGDAGVDTLRFVATTAVTVDLARGTAYSAQTGADLIEGFERVITGAGADKLYGDALANTLQAGDGNDSLYGGAGNDRLFGGEGVNVIDGGAGDDRLFGASSRDTIYGGTGNDIIYGSYDTDHMGGGTGTDRFIWRDVGELFRNTSAANFDRIVDFTPGQDRIDLSQIDWNGTGADNAFSFRGTAAISGAGQVAIRQAGAFTYVDISWQTAGVASSILLDGTLTLTASDFLL